MLKKTYPMRYHEERPFSADQLYPDKDHCVLDPEEPGECRTLPSKRGRPVQVVLYGPKERAEQAALQAAQQTPAASPESSEDENVYPTAFAIDSNWPPDHHRRKCTVCNHPFRGAIEEEFVHWASPDAISHHYSVGWRAVYRHAHAMGLFEERGRNLRSALGNIIEHSNHVAPSADTVVRAIRAYACVNKSGKWIEPTKRVAFSNEVGTTRRRSRRRSSSEALPDSGSGEIDAASEHIDAFEGQTADGPLVNRGEGDPASAAFLPAPHEPSEPIPAQEKANGSPTDQAWSFLEPEILIVNRAD